MGTLVEKENTLNLSSKLLGWFAGISSNDIKKISCSCGAVYIGDTDRSIDVRVSEDKRCLQTGLLSNSANSEYN